MGSCGTSTARSGSFSYGFHNLADGERSEDHMRGIDGVSFLLGGMTVAVIVVLVYLFA